jgi:hypothetical protein
MSRLAINLRAALTTYIFIAVFGLGTALFLSEAAHRPALIEALALA